MLTQDDIHSSLYQSGYNVGRTEALKKAKEAIKNDLKSFRDNGRRDPKGHVRAMMLIDKILADKQEGKNAE